MGVVVGQVVCDNTNDGVKAELNVWLNDAQLLEVIGVNNGFPL
jgi:hypothetical protein